MPRVRTLLAPACLMLCACASTPSERSPALSTDFDLGDLRVAAEAEAAAAAKAGAELAPDLQAPDSAASPQVQQMWTDVHEQFPDQHLTLLFGGRWMNDNDWEPVDDHLAGAVEFDASDPYTGHGYEAGVGYSWDSSNSGNRNVDGDVYDIYLGYRYTFWPSDWRDERTREVPDPQHPNQTKTVYNEDWRTYSGLYPYLGGGLALVHADYSNRGPGPDLTDNRFSGGVYLRAGVAYDMEGGTRIGLDYRHMFLTNTNIGEIDDSDFDQVMLTLGFRL